VAVKNRVDSYPGLGREAVRVAQIVGPEGVVDVLDVQPNMLDATRQRAQRHRVHNVVT
jgi:ubiquinone/menaquinone biosynthesis C-methylase UbiE